MFKHLLCPIDGSEPSLQALTHFSAFAVEQGAALTICMAVDPARAAAMTYGELQTAAMALGALDEEARGELENARALVAGTISAETLLRDGDPVDEILLAAREHRCDLIAMSTHGRTGLPRAFLGSVAEGVLRKSHLPVLLLPRLAIASAAPAARRPAQKV